MQLLPYFVFSFLIFLPPKCSLRWQYMKITQQEMESVDGPLLPIPLLQLSQSWHVPHADVRCCAAGVFSSCAVLRRLHSRGDQNCTARWLFYPDRRIWRESVPLAYQKCGQDFPSRRLIPDFLRWGDSKRRHFMLDRSDSGVRWWKLNGSKRNPRV